jgi:Holliday junction resolvase RusA-like endonuclease
MMNDGAVSFSFSGEPVAKGRPRATVRGKTQRFATMYTDPKTRAFESAVKKLAAVVMRGRPPMAGPLSVSLRFRFEPPKSLSKRARAAMLAGEVAYLGAKDLDNLGKAVLDGMNAVVFADDKQIVRLWLVKEASETAGVDVRVEPLTPQVTA